MIEYYGMCSSLLHDGILHGQTTFCNTVCKLSIPAEMLLNETLDQYLYNHWVQLKSFTHILLTIYSFDLHSLEL